MTVLVTGGAGFIGSNFILSFMQSHPTYRVVCLDSLTYAADTAYLRAVWEKDNFRFVKGDITDRYEVGKLFEEERPHAVVHFAAESHVDAALADPLLFYKTNVFGTQVLLDAALKFGVSRFHHVSTDEVYGPLPPGEPPFLEDAPLNPTNPYAVSKAASDLLALSYYKTHGLGVTVSRSSNNYGPHQHGEKWIPTCIGCLLNGDKIPLYGDGRQSRDWLHVLDHVAAIDLILHHGTGGEIYNISAHQEVENLDLAEGLCHLFNRPMTQIAHVKDRVGHDRRYGVDTKKIEALGWQPTVPFERGLQETAAWYKGRKTEK